MLLKIVRIYHNGRFCSRRRNGPLKTLKRRFMGGFVFCLEPVPEKRWIFPGNRIFQCPSFDGRSFAAGGRVCNADSLLSPFFGGEFGSLQFSKKNAVIAFSFVGTEADDFACGTCFGGFWLRWLRQQLWGLSIGSAVRRIGSPGEVDCEDSAFGGGVSAVRGRIRPLVVSATL